MPIDGQVDVITTLPNRYHSFTEKVPQSELQNGISIFRISLQRHQSGMIDQSRAFFTFVQEVIKKTAGRDYDIVFATSSRLMTSVLGAWIARRNKAKLYLDIRDIFADTIKDILPRQISWVVKPFFSMMEKWTIKRADVVNLVSPGFSEYFSTRYPKKKFSYFTNGIDEEFLRPTPAELSTPPSIAKKQPLTVLYAGNLGEGQGLHKIVPELAKLMGHRIHFKIIGDGGRKHALEVELSKIGVRNVELLPPIKQSQLLEAYCAADILFLHLNDYDAFKKVLPSKLFEYAASGKPIWAGISGYAAEFVRSEISNTVLFHPCDVESAIKSFDELILKDTPRTAFVAKYARANISLRMAEDILTMVGREH